MSGTAARGAEGGSAVLGLGSGARSTRSSPSAPGAGVEGAAGLQVVQVDQGDPGEAATAPSTSRHGDIHQHQGRPCRPARWLDSSAGSARPTRTDAPRLVGR